MYINGVATVTPAGDLVVLAGEVAKDGPRWDHLISLLPLLGHLPVGAVIIKLGKRELNLSKKLARDLDKLSIEQRKVLLAKAAAAKTTDEAVATIRQGVLASLGPEHHIATSRNLISTLRGGPWTPRFEKLFKRAGLTLEDAANKVRIPAHRGPHPEKYHRTIFDRLNKIQHHKNKERYRTLLLNELEAIAIEARTSGTELHGLLTERRPGTAP